MHDFDRLSRELSKLEAVQAELARIAERTDDARRHDLIVLRRALSLQIIEIGKVAEPIFAAAEPDMALEYRSKFSRMRSAAALHQADWPAVRLGEAVEQYMVSALGVRRANKEFVAWVRGALDHLRKG
ncbi:MAG TPA: hypothetical protein VNT42_04860 [Sphingomonas sp.]|nr:hypothetical protein [Sphingomonas sp.]